MAAASRCSGVQASQASLVGACRVARPAPFAGLRRANVLDKDVASCPNQQLRQSVVRRSAATGATRCVAVMQAYVAPKKILMLGGTRFIGLYLARMLVDAGHDVTLLTRGKKPVDARIPDDTDASYNRFASKIKHIACDRTDAAAMKAKLGGQGFEVVYDINGREAEECEIVLDAVGPIQQYIFCSSAGVYKKNDQMPHREEDEVDFKSRHKGKLFTEELLNKRGVNWTSVRPVYIYGPLNYNPVEEFFFHRLAAGRPICVPGSGMQVTQLGHVKDLASAFVKILGNPKASRQVYNVAGERFVTFDGIAKACAEAMGLPEPEIVHFNAKEFDFGKAKAFPMRDQHFFASVDKAMADLDWYPEFGLIDGLRDSYKKDFGRGTFRKAPDFTPDDMILAKLGRSAKSSSTAAKAAAGSAQYSPEQLAFLQRAGKVPAAGAPSKSSSSSAAGNAQYSEEQLAFLKRAGKLPGASASAGSASASSNGNGNGASSGQYSAEQLAFLQRAGKTPGASPASDSGRGRSRSPVTVGAGSSKYSKEQLEFLKRSGKL